METTPQSSTETNVNLVITDPYAHAIERGDIWIKKAQELAKLKQSLKQLETIVDLATQQLKDLSQGVDSKGGGYVFACSLRKGPIQYKDIPQLKGVDLEQFRGQSVETWKLTMEIK